MSRDANNVLLGGGVRVRVRVRVQRKFKGKIKGTTKPLMVSLDSVLAVVVFELPGHVHFTSQLMRGPATITEYAWMDGSSCLGDSASTFSL